MKKVYIYLALTVLIAAGLFALSFFYIDRHGRETFLYAIYRDNLLIGYDKVDRYEVENKLIYKSSLELPLDMLRGKTARKIIFEANGKNLIDYTEETEVSSAKSAIYIRNCGDTVSFLGTGGAVFAYLDHMPILGAFTMFAGETIATYTPLVRRYNFRKRGEQFFNVLTAISPDLPPLAGIVSITAIGRDVIDIEGKKIKCENLVLEMGNGNLASVWVARTFHNIIMIKIPKTRFKAVLCAKKEVIPVAEYTKKSNLYSERDEIVKNGDISLSGILSVPNNGGGPYPAVLLVWDSGPMDNTNMGVFTDIAHALAENGYGVLRLDKRGIGKSQGFFLTYAQAEEIDDLAKSVDLLKTMPEVDKSRIAVLGYGEGGFYAAHLAGMDEEVKGCVIISASARMNSIKNDFGKIKESIASSVSNDPEYLKFVMMTMDESKSLIKDKDDWITLLGSRIFTKAMKMQDNYDILEALVKVKVPVLILHGKKASANFTDEAKEMEAALSKSGNNNFRVVYFKGLDSCMGTVVKNNTVRDHIEVDPDVIKTIISWLDENLTAPASFSRENSPPLQASE